MRTITSVSHDAIKEIVKLHASASKKHEKMFLVESFIFISSFIDHGYTCDSLYVTQVQYENYPVLCGQFQCTIVSDHVMQKISQAVTPSGMIGIFYKKESPSWNNVASGVVLAQISDPGNMGTLIRSAAAFGYTSVVVVEGCSPYSYKAIQATAGTLPLVNLFVCTWQELVAHKKDMKLVALVVEGGKHPQEYKNQHALFVVGNEAHGLPQAWIKECDATCTLPMKREVESLNAAIAGSLVMALAR